ncbi:MAG: sugar phosphate nucleotidyltransferase [Francisella endosymbiont of Hyalomma asiaticum]
MRAKLAVYFGGKFRIIDFALSNCLKYGIRKIRVVTQYKSHSLLRHLQHGCYQYSKGLMKSIGIEVQLDAVYQNIDILRSMVLSMW